MDKREIINKESGLVVLKIADKNLRIKDLLIASTPLEMIETTGRMMEIDNKSKSAENSTKKNKPINLTFEFLLRM